MTDVTRLLIKGLSNRRIGVTSINSESSRSHTVFTCVVESRSESTADSISSFKTSRINLVDLAGSERQKLTGAAGERLKEAGNINRSLSFLVVFFCRKGQMALPFLSHPLFEFFSSPWCIFLKLSL